MSGAGASRGSGARGTGTAAALLLLGAALIAGAAFAPWGGRDYHDALTGPLTITLTGGDVLPALVPVALVILAAWAASAISRGVLRRILAWCAALAAFGIAVAALMTAWQLPDDEFTRQLRRPAEALGAAHTLIWGVLLAGLGGLMAAAGGALLATSRSAARSPRGAYDAHAAPAARREAAAREAVARLAAAGQAPAAGSDTRQGAAPVSDEVAAEQLWRSLDVGVDPTEDPSTDVIDEGSREPFVQGATEAQDTERHGEAR